ncbi:MAG: YkgJ family cysteine cluster protein [Epsilonproteobacteria bacterium]|nr:YkgJ family cysteine cluster protein [Campylobacterota bacterium]
MAVIEKDGFAFKFKEEACRECEGNCCIGESGYIWVSPDEIRAIADYLNMDTEEFMDLYLKKAGYRYSLKEEPYKNGYKCVFFENGCKIYDVRPMQCRTFPFWDYFKDEKNINLLIKECPGVIIEN